MSVPSRQDVTLALALGVLGQVDLLAPGLVSANVVGPRWAVAASYLAVSLVLVLRRSRPGVTFMVVLTVLSVQALTVGASEGNGTLLPALVATYSLAAHASRRSALVGLAMLPVMIALRELNNPQNTTADDIVNALGWDVTLFAAWLLGAYLRTRRLLVHELRERTLAAEQQREEREHAAVLEERARIARELHDVVAHNVSVMVVQAEAADELLSREPARVLGPLRTIQQIGRETLREMRQLLDVLREVDPVREPVPGLAALPALVERVRTAGCRSSSTCVARSTASRRVRTWRPTGSCRSR